MPRPGVTSLNLGTRTCLQCGAEFTRTRYSGSGKLENASSFRRRKYCGLTCQRRAVAQSGGHARAAAVDAIERRAWPWGTRMCGPRLTQSLYAIIERQVSAALDDAALVTEMRDTGAIEVLLETYFAKRKQEVLYGTVRRIKAHLATKEQRSA